MVTVREVPADKLIEKLKEELKKFKEMQPPAWSQFVKSGVHKQRPPEQMDFWHIRSAAILRRIYLDGPVGVERLRSYFGGPRKKGCRPRHFRKSSGNIIRKILQQLELLGFVEKTKRGRKITPKGQSFLDKIAYEVKK
jgi:small subunit ribosomal protein S19e